jgi:hypothetical protein
MNNLYNEKTINNKQSLVTSVASLYITKKEKKTNTITIQPKIVSDKKFLSSDSSLTIATKQSNPVLLKQKIL